MRSRCAVFERGNGGWTTPTIVSPFYAKVNVALTRCAPPLIGNSCTMITFLAWDIHDSCFDNCEQQLSDCKKHFINKLCWYCWFSEKKINQYNKEKLTFSRLRRRNHVYIWKPTAISVSQPVSRIARIAPVSGWTGGRKTRVNQLCGLFQVHN